MADASAPSGWPPSGRAGAAGSGGALTAWYPLRLSTPLATYVTGGRRIPDALGRAGLPEGRIAETWEVSDVEGRAATIANGALAGRSLRELTQADPQGLVGRNWSGPRFPILTKFIDAASMLPVHLHADDATARRLENEPNGKTEAWHILWAAPGATALVGTRPGVDASALRAALLEGDYDRVMHRLPVRSGETVYVPGGTLHSFGPDTLIYEIEQTSDIHQHAMDWNMEDGSPVPPDRRRANIGRLIEEWRPQPQPRFHPPLQVECAGGVQRAVCCAGPYFALERWTVPAASTLDYRFETAVILTNLGAPLTLGDATPLPRAGTLLLPAALGRVAVAGPADLLIGYLPDLEADVRAPLSRAGYAASLIDRLGA